MYHCCSDTSPSRVCQLLYLESILCFNFGCVYKRPHQYLLNQKESMDQTLHMSLVRLELVKQMKFMQADVLLLFFLAGQTCRRSGSPKFNHPSENMFLLIIVQPWHQITPQKRLEFASSHFQACI